MTKNKLIAPFLKWVGGKRQLLNEIEALLPKKIATYYEPFVGGGAVFFNLQPKRAVINDSNGELINVYKVIKHDLPKLIDDLKKHKNDEDYFYQLRSIDRTENFKKITDVERASRVIYLNKTCFNGLYRVNSSGEFNSPFGKYKNPNIVNEPTLKAVNRFLNANDVTILNVDYEDCLKTVEKNAFVYLDPPYHPVSVSSNFTGYIQGGWNIYDQVRLKGVCDRLTKSGVKFLQSNSSADFIKDLYKEYHISIVKANRAINSDGEKRGEIDELLIRNYE